MTEHSLTEEIRQIGRRARNAARMVMSASPAVKAQALTILAELLRTRQAEILAANTLDVQAAATAGMDPARLDRLAMTPAVLAAMAEACLQVAAMPDPVGVIETQWQRPNGLLVGKMRVPLGVVAMIFESRPNVTIDAAILCLKAGNAVILRGGSEAIRSNLALAALLHESLKRSGLPPDAVQVLDMTDRAAVTELCRLDEYVDVMIPRGDRKSVV